MALHFLAHILGLDNASGPWYLFWSGFAGDLGLFGGGTLIYRKHNCHQRHCWRLGLHHVSGTPYVVCRKHHPDIDQEQA